MRSFLASLPFAALTFCCWGIYGPVLHHGVHAMAGSKLRPFICVGMAYFVIAVVIPLLLLKFKGEKGHWSKAGAAWSLFAGSCGAIGALGIIMALSSGGKPIYVMPLVFGCAPVVNTFVSMWMTKSFKDAGPIFYVGIVMVAMGGAGVMFFKPSPAPKTAEQHEDPQSLEKEASGADHAPKAETPPAKASLPFSSLLSVIGSIALTALCWGSYGSVLHKGQHLLGDSRLRALLCVGLSYFLIAVLVPIGLLLVGYEPAPKVSATDSLAPPSAQIASDESTDPESKPDVDGKPDSVEHPAASAKGHSDAPHYFTGALWALLAGAAGAGGALGMILAFNFGGKPIYVMPIVFGCAPVVNTFLQMIENNLFGQVPPMFYGSLGLVIAGAATVLIFSPKPKRKPPATDKVEPQDPEPAEEDAAIDSHES